MRANIYIAKKLQIYNFIVFGQWISFHKAKNYIESNKIKNVYLLGNKKMSLNIYIRADLFLSTSLYEPSD